MHLKVKETLISICELVVSCIFHKYAQHMRVDSEQQSKEEDALQRCVHMDADGLLVIRYTCHVCWV